MKDPIEVWNNIVKRTYSAVNTTSNDDDCPVNYPRNVAKRIVTGKHRSKLILNK